MKKLIIYIPDDHQHLPYIKPRQYIEEDLSVTEVFGAIHAAGMQLEESLRLQLMTQIMGTQKQEEK